MTVESSGRHQQRQQRRFESKRLSSGMIEHCSQGDALERLPRVFLLVVDALW